MRLVKISTCLLTFGMAPLAIAIALDFYIVSNVVLHAPSIAKLLDEEARRAQAPLASPVHEYFWLLHVMDRLFLRVVGGSYIDWSHPAKPVRRDSF